MLVDKDLSISTSQGPDSSEIRLPPPDPARNPNVDAGFSAKDSVYFKQSDVGSSGFGAKHTCAVGNSFSHELTLRYLCENPKLGFSGNDFSSNGSSSLKRKDVMLESSCQEERWVERDFLRLSDNRVGSSKRGLEEGTESGRDKNPKVEALNLSLALPDASSPLNASIAAMHNDDLDPPARPKPSRSVHSLAPSAKTTQATNSNDLTAASLSYSHSHPFSHNPSCSLTKNSTDFNEYSMGSYKKENDQIWNFGDGTNGSVHSRFRPVGDGVALSNHSGGVFPMINGGRFLNKDLFNGVYGPAASDTTPFFPSELPARPGLDSVSGDSRGRAMDHLKASDNLDGTGTRKVSKPERVLQEIVSESISVVAQTLQELPDETIESTKEYLKSLIAASGSKHDLFGYQRLLNRRSDLSRETLAKAHRAQLEILVAIKFGLEDFVSGKVRVPTTELIEIFMLMRCRNVSCKLMLPVDDCDCKICSGTKGFCRECMCPVCMKFDCANNTCSWVGCDVCSHWCHAVCGLEKKLFRPGPSLRRSSKTTEMQFHCLGCGHASEMFGFVEDVFKNFARDWSLETLIKELNCVRKIFEGSKDIRGKQLHLKAVETATRLARAEVSLLEACSSLLQFFDSVESTWKLPALEVNEEAAPVEAIIMKESIPLPPKSGTLTTCSSNPIPDMAPRGECCSFKSSHGADELGGALTKKDPFYGLEGIIRIKEAESRLFQKRADEARKEAEEYRRLVRTRTEKLEEEYSQKLATLSLKEIEDRRKKKMEELKLLESSHCDYYNMKIRMQAEIAGLLERMEATKRQWV